MNHHQIIYDYGSRNPLKWRDYNTKKKKMARPYSCDVVAIKEGDATEIKDRKAGEWAYPEGKYDHCSKFAYR